MDSYKERFEALQKRRQELCRGSEARRVNELKISLLANVKQQLQSSDELEELEKCSVNIDELTAEAEREKQLRQRRRGRKNCNRDHSDNILDAKLRRLNNDTPVKLSNEFSNDECTSRSDTVPISEYTSNINKSGITESSVVRSSEVKASTLTPACPITSTAIEKNQGLTSKVRPVIQNMKSSTPVAVQNIQFTKTVIKGNTGLSQSTIQSTKTSAQSSTPVSGSHSEVDVKWLELKPYLTINDHLVKTTGSGRRPRSHLEEKLEKAIEANDVEMAEIYSDKLAAREFGIRIATAIDAKAYLEKQKAEKTAREAAKKKKLAWGFVPKHRWETKGNM